MNILPIAKRIWIADRLLAGDTISVTSDVVHVSKITVASFAGKLGSACDRLWNELLSTRPATGLILGQDVFFLDRAANLPDLPTCVVAFIEDMTKALIGYGYGIDTATAASEGRAAVARWNDEITFEIGVNGKGHRPVKIRGSSLKREETARALLSIFAAHYNLVATDESGETPAMRLGLSEDPWTVEQVVRAALQEYVNVDPIPARFTAPAEVLVAGLPTPAPPAIESAPEPLAPMAGKTVKIHYGAPATLSTCKLTMISDVGTNGTLVIGDVTCGLCLARAAKINHEPVSMVAPEPPPVVVAPSSAEALPSGSGDAERIVVVPAPRPAMPPARAARPVSSSGFRGVTPSNGAWRAAVCVGGAVITIGTYAKPEEAARAYDAKALELKGPGAVVNFEASRTSHEPPPAPRAAKRGRKPKPTEQDPADQQSYLALVTGQRQPGRLPVTPNVITHKDIEGEQESALIRRFQNGDADAGGILAQAHEKLIDYFSKRQRRGCSDAEYEDIKQAARLGFLRAVQKFDHDRGTKLSTYAINWIKTFVQGHNDNTRTAIRVPRNILVERRKAARRGIEVEDLAGATPPAIETAQYNYAGVSTDAPLAEDGWTLGDMLADESASPERAMAYAEEQEALRRKLANAMRGLTDREAEVIRRVDLADDPETLQEVGDSLGLSRERVRQLQAKGHAKLRIILSDKADDVDSLSEEDDAESPQELLVTERQRRGKKSSSGFFGVSFVKSTGKWRVTLYDNGKSRSHGEWLTAESAARAYDVVALHFKGPHAELNFPNDRQSTIAAIASATATGQTLVVQALVARERSAPPPDPAPMVEPPFQPVVLEPEAPSPLDVGAAHADDVSCPVWTMIVEFPIIQPAVLPAPPVPTASIHENVEHLDDDARGEEIAPGPRGLRAALGQASQPREPSPLIVATDIVTPAEKTRAPRPSKARPERIIIETTDEIADYTVRHLGPPRPAALLDPSRPPTRPSQGIEILDD